MDRVGNKKGFGGLIMLLGFVMLCTNLHSIVVFIPGRIRRSLIKLSLIRIQTMLAFSSL